MKIKRIMGIGAIGFFLSVAAQATTAVTVSTWNIWQGKNFKEVLHELEHTILKDSDILNLQEVLVDKGQAEKIARKLNYEYVSHGSNVIMTRFQIVDSGYVTVNPETKRKALWADLSTHRGVILRVYSPHLSYKVRTSPFIPEVRQSEAEKILEHAASSKGPVIIAGDLNTVGNFISGHESEGAIRILKAQGYTDTLASVPVRTHRLVGRVDWIFTKGFQTLFAFKGEYSGSDHRWMQSILALNP